MESLYLGKDLKIGEYLVRYRSIKSEPILVIKSYVGRSNQFSYIIINLTCLLNTYSE